MPESKIHVYHNCSIDHDEHRFKEIVVKPFGDYLQEHFKNLKFPHRHSFYHIVFFTKGSGSHTIDFIRFPVRAFEIYFMVPGQVHSWNFEGEVDGYVINFTNNFLGSFLLNHGYLDQFSFFSGSGEDSVLFLPARIQHEVIELFEEMSDEAREGKDNNPDMLRVLLIKLFIIVHRSGAIEGKTIQPETKLLLRNFRKAVDQYYQTIRLPKEYASLLYVTPNYLNALCQQELGKSAGQVIRDRVLLEAKRLLTNVDLSISEIANQLNFTDNSYFNKFFKKYLDLTPEKFRKSFHLQ